MTEQSTPELPDWTPPNVSAILADFEAQAPSVPNLDLIDQYIAAGNLIALRSLFDIMMRNRNRAEHLSNVLLSYIHAQQTKEPHVREYFDRQIREYEISGRKMIGAPEHRTERKTNSGRERPTSKRSAPQAPAVAQEW